MKEFYENPLLKNSHNYPDSVFLFKKVKGRNVLQGKKAKDITSFLFYEVEEIKNILIAPNETTMFEVVKKVFGIESFDKIKLLQFYEAYNHIIDQVSSIYKREKLLCSEPSEQLLNAGVEKMQIFGALNLLDDIAQRYSKSPEEVEKWNYALIFSLSLKIKYEADIRKNIEYANGRN